MNLFLIPNPVEFGTCRNSSTAGAGGERGSRVNRERGAGHLKAIIWTLILAALVYVMVKVLPVLMNEYQFKDGIQNIARNASVTPQSNDQILKAVLKEAQDENLRSSPKM